MTSACACGRLRAHPTRGFRVTPTGTPAAAAEGATSRPAHALLDVLRPLDRILEQAAQRADRLYGPAGADPHRGLYVTAADVEQLLAREPGAPVLGMDAVDALSAAPPLVELGRLFGLEPFDLAVLAVALAPELDVRYERLYGYLQDDVTRRRPTVDLVLDLTSATPDERLERRVRFAPHAPLRRNTLVRLIADPAHVEPPLLSQYVAVEPAVVSWLSGDGGVDPRLRIAAELLEPAEAELPASLRDAAALMAAGTLPPMYLHGPRGSGRRTVAAALAGAAGRMLLAVDVDRALDLDPQLEWLPAVAARDAVLNRALLLLSPVDTLAAEERAPARRRLEHALREGAPPILAGSAERPPLDLTGVVVVPVRLPAADARAELWRSAAARHGGELAPETARDLAEAFRLGAAAIEAAATRAAAGARLAGSAPDANALFAAARAESSGRLRDLARRLEPRRTWEDLVLPRDRVETLREICGVVRHRNRVYRSWGFGTRLATGIGLTALFTGPSGTGKTLAAEVIAGELGLDLYAIDLSSIVSKYIGETEKNLARVFDAAEAANAILFFDEADALFGKRTEIRDAHDRYANVEVSYLLQRIESFDGVVVLATNLRKNMDDAFVRRMQFTVDFPLPDEEDRLRIWEVLWPEAAPVADLDLRGFACRFELAGGNIRNVVLAAAFLAAEDGDVVTTEHVLRATRREYAKLGKVVGESEFDA